MYNTIAALAIISCIATEVVCIRLLRAHIRCRSERRTDERREYYRVRAYSEKDIQRAMKLNRSALWKAVNR